MGRNGAFSGDFGKGRMATKSKLERAVDAQADSLSEAQKEIVFSQLSIYRQNNARMSDIKALLESVDTRGAATLDEVRAKQAQRSTLSYEYNQIATANSRIAADLFSFLEG